MKVLFLIDCLVSGGKERRLVELMKALQFKTGVDFELVLMSEDIHYHEVKNLGINIHFVIRKTRKDPAIFYRLYKLSKDIKPDIIHCWDTMTAIYISPVCKLLSIKLVNGVIVDSPEKRNIFNKYWLRARLTFPFANIIIGNSRAGLEAYSAPVKKSRVIYNGFDFERIKNVKPVELIKDQLKISTKYVIGMVATFSDMKDYPTYFAAAQIVLAKRKDIVFLAIGKDTDSDMARSLISDEYKDYFRLLGASSDIESLVNILDICILSTFTEGISNAILEYMAFGKPVIASRGGGTSEILEDNKSGFIVDRSNPSQVAAKIDELLDNPSLRLEMGENGKERIREFFSIEKMTNEYISTYKYLLA